MKRLICFFKGHKRGEIWYEPWNKNWHIECKRCGYKYNYFSPIARLIGEEMRIGFDGN